MIPTEGEADLVSPPPVSSWLIQWEWRREGEGEVEPKTIAKYGIGKERKRKGRNFWAGDLPNCMCDCMLKQNGGKYFYMAVTTDFFLCPGKTSQSFEQ